MTNPVVIKLHVIDQTPVSPKAGGGWLGGWIAHKIDFVVRQVGTKMQLEFGSSAAQQQIRDQVLIFLLQCKWEIMGDGNERPADGGWESLPAGTQLELEAAYRADQQFVSVSTATSSEGRTNLHTMMHAQTNPQGVEVQLHVRVRSPVPSHHWLMRTRPTLRMQKTELFGTCCAAYGSAGQDQWTAEPQKAYVSQPDR